MLGSTTDADDAVQETLLAAWRGWPQFEGRAAPRTWLYRIATNRCLNAIRDGRRRPPVAPTPPFDPPPPTAFGDVTWLQPYPQPLIDAMAGLGDPMSATVRREHVELAFIVALQRLPPRQAAAVVLADVLGFGPAEVAGMLDATPQAVKGLLQRGRAGLVDAGVGTPQSEAAAGAERALARRLAAAFVADDVDGVVALLTDDAWLAMPPAPHEYHGRAAIGRFLQARCDWYREQGCRVAVTSTSVNAQPAFRTWAVVGRTGERFATGLLVVSGAATGGGVGRLTHFLAV